MGMPHPERPHLIAFLKTLRDSLIEAFESLEPVCRFERREWKHAEEGGGESALLRGSRIERGAVNWSGVGGQAFPFEGAKGPFFATGVSVILHMSNPHAPTAHFNLRFIETAERYWFGGGYDLTPMGFPYEEDTVHFHRTAEAAVTPFGDHLYALFSQQASTYFYIPHRKKERGVGGLFFDHLNTGDFSRDVALWQAIGNSFLPAVMPLYHRRLLHPFTEEERERQLHHRAHYVEFNLLYDRGTRFGFQSGGDPEAILYSLPPVVKW